MILFKAFVPVGMTNPISNILVNYLFIYLFCNQSFYLSPFTLFNFKALCTKIMDVTFYVYFSHQLYNAHVLYLFVGHTQGSTKVATAGSTLSKYLLTIINVCIQHHKLEHMVYIFSQDDYH